MEYYEPESYSQLFVIKSVSMGHDFYLTELAHRVESGAISESVRDGALMQHRAVKAHKAFMAEVQGLAHEVQSEHDEDSWID